LLFERDDKAVNMFGVISDWIKVLNNTSDRFQAVLGVFMQDYTFADAIRHLGNVCFWLLADENLGLLKCPLLAIYRHLPNPDVTSAESRHHSQ